MDAQRKKIKLVIGLGNADRRYANTYHNVGHLFAKWVREKSMIHDSRFMIHENDGFMNESGGFVTKTMKKAGAKPSELLIAHDDSDLVLGAYKLQFGRGAAGHKGVASVIAALGTQNFWRLRIGIRPQAERVHAKAEKFVLKSISAAHKKILEKVFARAAEEITENC